MKEVVYERASLYFTASISKDNMRIQFKVLGLTLTRRNRNTLSCVSSVNPHQPTNFLPLFQCSTLSFTLFIFHSLLSSLTHRIHHRNSFGFPVCNPPVTDPLVNRLLRRGRTKSDLEPLGTIHKCFSECNSFHRDMFCLPTWILKRQELQLEPYTHNPHPYTHHEFTLKHKHT